MKKYRTIGVGIILAALGFWLALASFADIRQAISRKSWLTTDGIIVDSRMSGVRNLRPGVVYRYSVADTDYLDSTSLDAPGFGSRANRKGVAMKLIADYPPGRTVKVFYDPGNPGSSTLRPYPSWSLYGRSGLGLLLLAAGAFLASRSILNMRRST